jgi:hypothetical protein
MVGRNNHGSSISVVLLNLLTNVPTYSTHSCWPLKATKVSLSLRNSSSSVKGLKDPAVWGTMFAPSLFKEYIYNFQSKPAPAISRLYPASVMFTFPVKASSHQTLRNPKPWTTSNLLQKEHLTARLTPRRTATWGAYDRSKSVQSDAKKKRKTPRPKWPAPALKLRMLM